MRRLVGLPLDARQEQEIMRLLDDAGIRYKETRSPFRLLSADALWVEDEDYPRARAILEDEAQAYAETARAAWNAEWVAEHQGSYLRWLWSRMRRASPAGLLTALFMIALVAVMLFYPLAYVFR
jgi:hypothetical protein